MKVDGQYWITGGLYFITRGLTGRGEDDWGDWGEGCWAEVLEESVVDWGAGKEIALGILGERHEACNFSFFDGLFGGCRWLEWAKRRGGGESFCWRWEGSECSSAGVGDEERGCDGGLGKRE